MKAKSLINKSIITLLFLSFFISVAYSQKNRNDNCKYIIDNVDIYSKIRTVKTNGEFVFDIKSSVVGIMMD